MSQTLTAADVEAIERATFDALPPESLEEIGGWLLGLDRGTVGRAHSAVPLRHDAADASVVDLVEARYADAGLRAVFRLPAVPAFDAVRERLTARGHVATKPTRVFVARIADMAAVPHGAQDTSAECLAAPDEAWRSVFLGEGFDPVDGASRVAILGRARHASFMRVRSDGATVAAGMGSFSQGWASVHGMRTLPSHRGRGMAGSILGAIAAQAQALGLARAFLQVEASNTGAQALYRRFGFNGAWDYHYLARGSVD